MKSNDCSTEKVSTEGEIEEIRSRLPDERKLQDLAAFYAAFSDPTRLKIVLALMERELCNFDIARIIGATPSAVSHQLRLLRSMRLVRFRRKGRKVFYALDDQHVYSILELAILHFKEEKTGNG